MKKVVLITGANGMLAKQLTKQLVCDYSLRFLTRNVTRRNEYSWDIDNRYIDPEALKEVNFVIHLAGASIADKRWTKVRKQRILSSRVDSGLLILDELKKQHITLDAFVSASAIGYYGSTTSDTIFNEESSKGNDYLSSVCDEWEKTAFLFKSENVAKRVSVLRLGIILSYENGALKKIVQPIKFGFGAGLGSGNQYMPWIHINDLCNMFKFAIENPKMIGTFNAVSPYHVTNIALTKSIAKLLNRKILLPNIPSVVIKAIFGEMSMILLEGNRVASDKIIQLGFQFEFSDLTLALKDVLGLNS